MQSIKEIINDAGGLDWLKAGNWIRIENPPYMRLVIEYVGKRRLPIKDNPFFDAISVAHYSEQNGDAMRDPEIVYLVDGSKLESWIPIYFLNDYAGVEQEVIRDGGVAIKLSKELHSFSKLWDKNIREQGFIEAAKKPESRRAA